ncbi:MAG: LptE family protein [Verrucomicrobia bacterium]|nr:LptE family protein [Verrucomicrobiota bacterium]MDA1086733.1 LptE family protein [Verrucomicrobiota bacterium]
MKSWPVLLGIALCLGGCASYQLGSTLPKDIQSVYIPVFTNETDEPGVESETTLAAIREFQNDGALRVTTEDSADLILTVTVREFQLKPLRYKREQATTAEEYRLTLVADIVATRTSDGSVLAERTHLEGDAEFTLASDMRAAKRDALPVAAKDLAHKIVEAVVESW